MHKRKALKIANISKPGYHRDSGDGAAVGLYLQVTPRADRTGVSKSWIYRYVSPQDGKARWMGLGSVDLVSLAEARAAAVEARKQARVLRRDPIAERDARLMQERVDKARQVTWAECVDHYLAAHGDSWKNNKHRDQWETTLKKDAALLMPLPVASIDTALVMKVLEPIWRTKTETANRLRGRIERVLAFAAVREFRKGDNPARWRGHLDHLLPKRSKVSAVKHHAALPYAELPAFMADLRGRDSISAKALEFTILCATRTNETIFAKWDEVDLVSKIWTIPATRMKAKRGHRIPLSERAVEILKYLPREGTYVFPGARKGRPLSNMAMLELIRGMMGPGYTVHGFRSTFKDWARERTSYPNEVSESALAHVNGDKVEAAYARGDLFEKRRRLMAEWARFSFKKSYGLTDNVAALRVKAIP
jgi:integrase